MIRDKIDTYIRGFPMKKDLYLMRHGETLFNVQHKIQGWCDSPLTTKGIEDCKKMGEKLKDIPFDHFYCSTAERSVDSLELVRPGVVYTRLKGIRERYFGALEGEHQYLQQNQNFDQLAEIYGGESTKEVVDRMLNTLTSLMEKEDHQTVLAIVHGGATVCLTHYLTDQPMGRLSNSSVLHMEYEDGQFEIKEIISL